MKYTLRKILGDTHVPSLLTWSPVPLPLPKARARHSFKMKHSSHCTMAGSMSSVLYRHAWHLTAATSRAQQENSKKVFTIQP